MPLPTFDAAALLAAWQRHAPRGAAWPRDSDAVQTQVAAAQMPSWATLYARSNNFVVDAFPSSTSELLTDWENSLGLPDACSGLGATTQARRGQVVARITGRGGQSVPYFTRYAANLGYTVTITEFAPARFGRMKFGQPIYGPAWAHVWRVTMPATTIQRFKFNADAFGESWATWSNGPVNCELNRLKPAQTLLQITYSS